MPLQMHIAQERSKSIRRITACFKKLSKSAGVRLSAAAMLVCSTPGWTQQAHAWLVPVRPCVETSRGAKTSDLSPSECAGTSKHLTVDDLCRSCAKQGCLTRSVASWLPMACSCKQPLSAWQRQKNTGK